METLVVDSGSTDRTLEIVAARPSVRLHQIPNSEFGHGRTRNLAARLAKGRLLAFLTQDAIPAHDGWLAELVAPLDPAGIGAVGSVGKQIPRGNCFPLLKYEINGVFAKLGPDDRVTVEQRGETAPEGLALDEMAFYSDVNSATPRQFLLEVIPYQDLPYSEDFAFGAEVILAGYKKAYSPGGSVIHSNDLTLSEYRRRFFEEVVARRRVGNFVPPLTRWKQLLRTGYGVLTDSGKIIADRDYGVFATIGWLARNPWYHVAKWQSMYAGSHVDLDDEGAIARGSLESKRRPG